MIPQKEKTCKAEGCNNSFKPFKSTDKYCSFNCAKSDQKPKENKPFKPIRKSSPKRAKENREYLKRRKEFLSLPENLVCFIEGCNRKATTVEHRAGRSGKKLLEVKYWAPCCTEHNLELENNPELSKKYQLSKLHEGNK